jgi:hypothetical protein
LTGLERAVKPQAAALWTRNLALEEGKTVTERLKIGIEYCVK